MANRTKLTPRARARFLEILRTTANVSEGARRIGMRRQSVYEAKERDPEFSAAWEEAIETAGDALEAEAWRRGVTGVERPLTAFGKLVKDDDGKVVTVREYSDHLLISLLKAHRPARFRENISMHHTGLEGLGERLDAAARRFEEQERLERERLLARTVIDAEAVPMLSLDHKT